MSPKFDIFATSFLFSPERQQQSDAKNINDYNCWRISIDWLVWRLAIIGWIFWYLRVRDWKGLYFSGRTENREQNIQWWWLVLHSNKSYIFQPSQFLLSEIKKYRTSCQFFIFAGVSPSVPPYLSIFSINQYRLVALELLETIPELALTFY